MKASWLDRTGQMWKLYVFACGVIASCAAVITLFISAAGSKPPYATLGAVSLLVTGATFTWLFTSIRCRVCLRRPAWWLFRRTVISGNFVIPLIATQDCPICHDEGRSCAPFDKQRQNRTTARIASND